MSVNYRCLLIGNANCGKTSLFNRLTGLNQRTGNFSGVTVDIAVGDVKYKNEKLEVVDLPGSFSLNASTEDKKTLTRFLMNRKPSDKIIFVLDALLLERSMQFLFQIIDLGSPIILAITMKDILKKRNVGLDIEKLEKELGIKAVLLNSKSGDGVEELKELLFKEESFNATKRSWTWDDKREAFIQKLVTKIASEEPGYIEFIVSNGLKKLSGEKLQKELPGLELLAPEVKKYVEDEFHKSGLSYNYQEEVIYKSFRIKNILSLIYTSSGEHRKSFGDKADKYLLHPVYGFLIFLIIMGFMFQVLFSFSEYPMTMIENFFTWGEAYLEKTLPGGPLARLLTGGVIKGVGSVLVFIPQISLLFLFIGMMEESGYLSRVSFVMDKLMGRFGLSGKSFIPLLSSAACAVPAIMGTRTIENRSDKMATILISPLVTCSARYPVYILVIGTIFPEKTFLGFITLKAIMLFGLFILGISTAMLFALIFKKTFFKHESSYFMIEIPSYKVPSVKNLLIAVYQKVKLFVINSGTFILYISVVLWFLVNYPMKETVVIIDSAEKIEYASPKITESYAATLGHYVEPVIRPLGFDWKIGIGIITSFAAREVIVSTLAIIYDVEGDENSPGLKSAMKNDMNPVTGKNSWNLLTAMSLLIFFAYASQCMSTLAVVRQETRSYIWPSFLFIYMSILAYLSSLLVYQVGKMMGLG